MDEPATTRGLKLPGRPVRWWSRAAWWFVPAVVFLCMTLPHLDQGAFRKDTGRYGAVGLQMWRTGEFWTPHLQPDTLYFNKPPLGFWIHGASLHALGVGVWQARLPTVLAGLGIVLLIGAIVRRFADRTRALAAGVILATTLEFFRRTKEISLDMWQALFVFAAVWCVCVALTPRGRSGRNLPLWFGLAGVALGLALMSKPLTGLAAVPVLGVWMVAFGSARRVWWLALSTVVAVLVAAPWHLGMASIHGEAFTGNYFGAEVANRAAGLKETKPWWFYFKEMGEYHWPWLIAVVGGLIGWAIHFPRGFGRLDRRGLALGVVWSVCWLALLTAFPDKRPRYGLLFYPTLAIVSAVWLFDVVPARTRRGLLRAAPVIVGVVVAGAAVFAVLPVRVNRPADPGFEAIAGWMREHPARVVMAGSIESNDNGRLYLLAGRWAQREGGATHPEAPRDAAWVWADYGTPKRPLPAGHRVILESGVLRLSEPAD